MRDSIKVIILLGVSFLLTYFEDSFGGLPLAMGLACGNIVLMVSVVAILITAPLGAFLIDLTYGKFLNR